MSPKQYCDDLFLLSVSSSMEDRLEGGDLFPEDSLEENLPTTQSLRLNFPVLNASRVIPHS